MRSDVQEIQSKWSSTSWRS